jgi:hypothetical protein
VRFFPQLDDKTQTDSKKFELLKFVSSPFGPDVWLYRLHGAEQPR